MTSNRVLGEKLDRALDRIDRDGNVKGKHRGLLGGYCAEGALIRNGDRSDLAALDNATARHTRHGCLAGANDSGNLRDLRKVAAKLRGNTPRKGVTHQQRITQQKAEKAEATKTARQRPGAVPTNTTGPRLVLLTVTALVAVGLVVHYAALLLLILHIAVLVALSTAVLVGGIWGGHALFEAVDWNHVEAWMGRNRARAAERRAVRIETVRARADLLAETELARQPIALGPAAPLSTDDVLQTDWTQPHRHPEQRQAQTTTGRA